MKWREIYEDKEIQALQAEATYHLGRVLYEGELDFDRAVSQLEEAIRLDPGNIAAHYYLGRAIQEQIARNTSRRAEEALRYYLLNGAPLGHEDEVRGLIGSRQRAGQSSR